MLTLVLAQTHCTEIRYCNSIRGQSICSSAHSNIGCLSTHCSLSSAFTITLCRLCSASPTYIRMYAPFAVSLLSEQLPAHTSTWLCIKESSEATYPTHSSPVDGRTHKTDSRHVRCIYCGSFPANWSRHIQTLRKNAADKDTEEKGLILNQAVWDRIRWTSYIFHIHLQTAHLTILLTHKHYSISHVRTYVCTVHLPHLHTRIHLLMHGGMAEVGMAMTSVMYICTYVRTSYFMGKICSIMRCITPSEIKGCAKVTDT